jgi:hypothetical protein
VSPVDPGLTASTEGSPRPADQWSGHEGWEAYQHKVVCTEISEKSCACSRKSAFRDKGAATRILRGRKSFHQGSVHGIARNLVKDLHGGWKDCRGKEVSVKERFLGGYGSWRAEDWYKGLAPACCIFSLFSTLSDGLRESCVSVTKLIFVSRLFSLVSSLALVHALSLALVRNGESSIDTYLQ